MIFNITLGIISHNVLRDYNISTFIFAIYSPRPPNNPYPPNMISVSDINLIASMECAEYPQPPPWPKDAQDIY